VEKDRLGRRRASFEAEMWALGVGLVLGWGFCWSRGLGVCRHRRSDHEDDDGDGEKALGRKEGWDIWVEADGLEWED
jgi:hypothetical protein